MNRRSKTYAVRVFVVIAIMLALVSAGIIVMVQLSLAERQDSSCTEHAALQHKQTRHTGDTTDRQPKQAGSLELNSNLHQQKQQPFSSEPAETTTESTDSKLLLLGAIAGKDSDTRALIEDRESNTLKVYKTDQQIDGGYIEKIETDRVVVLREGRRYELKRAVDLPEPATAQVTTSNKSCLSTAEQSHSQPPVSNTVLTASNSTVPKTPLDSLEMVLREAELEPCQLQDDVQGLTIKDIKNIPMAGDADLRTGDVIHSINGHQLVSKQQTWQVIKKARSEDTIDIEVLCRD